jgi:segregation and condensation protein A
MISSEAHFNRDAVRVTLELFDGPLDLLLHLIQVQRIDINSISISEITDQYLAALDLMMELDLDIAGEYLVMAATLILLKSKSLLPPAPGIESESEGDLDPRENLIRQLRQYQTFREAGNYLQGLGDFRAEQFTRGGVQEELEEHKDWLIEVTLIDLLRSLSSVIQRKQQGQIRIVVPNPVSVREKMALVIQALSLEGSILISKIFSSCQTKQDAIVVFLAVLELVRIHVIQARQRRMFGDIRLSLLQEENRAWLHGTAVFHRFGRSSSVCFE